MRFKALLPLMLVAACGGAGQPTETPASAPPAVEPRASVVGSAASAVRVTADTPLATASLASFTAPAGWTVATLDGHQVLTGPEPDLKLLLAESDAVSAEQAAAQAWPLLHPGFARPVKLDQPEPGRRGWQEVHSIAYETSPNEQLVVHAIVLRHGPRWLVVAMESSLGSMEKREAAVELVLQSVRPTGYTRESFAGKTAAQLDGARIQQIVDVVEAGRRALDIPGVALTLVQGDKVVYEGGLGLRELGKPARVDVDTRFVVASNTKALTTLLLAKQVDQGKFGWDTPVSTVHPGFRLGDAASTGKVLMRHLVCACTGLPRQDMEWLFEYGKASPRSVLEVLATCQPTTQFGETFQYSNLMAGAAGFVAGHVAYPEEKDLGVAYDRAMASEIFGPLGMTNTTFDFARAMRGNYASPHGQDVKGAMRVGSQGLNMAVVSIRPAGGAWSSARDLTRYVQLELARGKLPDGKVLVSEANLVARAAPQVRLGETASYGMGLMVDAEWGATVVHHGGDLPGYHSDMFWLPEHGVGGVILTNAEGGWALRRPFLRRTLEVLFDGKAEAMDDVLAAAKSELSAWAKQRERLVAPAAAELVEALAPRYHNDALGTISVQRRGTRTMLDVGEWQSEVASRRNDDGTSSLHTINPGLDRFGFVLGEQAGKRVLIMRDRQHEYVFTESP